MSDELEDPGPLLAPEQVARAQRELVSIESALVELEVTGAVMSTIQTAMLEQRRWVLRGLLAQTHADRWRAAAQAQKWADIHRKACDSSADEILRAWEIEQRRRKQLAVVDGGAS